MNVEDPKKEGTKEWWSKKYQESDGYLFGKEPSPFLAENVEFLRKGETFDVAMGEGRNSVFLASKGFNVTGVDFAERAVERAKALAAEKKVKLELKSQSLDFFLIPLMKYDTILVTDYHPHLALMKSLARGLNKGGTLLLEGYALEQLRIEGGYRPGSFECFTPNEVLNHVRDLHVVYYNERRISPKESRVQLLARKALR